jgi:hypothetical protein
MSEKKQRRGNLIGFVCAGRQGRASDLNMTEEQRVYFGLAMDKLKRSISSFLPLWKTIEISILDK